MTAPVFTLVGATKAFGPADQVVALADADLTVAAGERLALVGASGSGKTTLLHLLGTLERPTSGRVEILGRDVAGLGDREVSALRAAHIGFVFQQFFLLGHLDAVDNVAQGLLYRPGLTRRARRRAAIEALERVGLGPRLSHRPGELSGGERQRVAIARAVVGRPAAILADEPTGNLDSATGALVVGLLLELSRDGTCLVVATHDREVAAAMDRRVVVRDGRLVAEGAGW